MKSIAGEITLVTGGGGGLGRLTALRLANLGAIVVIWDVNKAGMEETVKLVQTAGGTCYGYVCDLCDKEDIYKKAELVRKEVGKVTILINNAGVAQGLKFLDSPDKLLIRTMDVNVMSHFWANGYDINMTAVCPFFIRSTGMFGEVSPKFLPRLTPNKVADRIVTAVRCNEKLVIIPGYIRLLLVAKCFLPWASTTMFLQNLLVDKISDNTSNNVTLKKEEIIPGMVTKDPDTSVIHQQLTRRISSSERKP
ncbi:Epidermal retinol dehydrogenase [Apis cerana cerana]|uniref:Epidermal retinol dehydrogenase n=1 Tax=Apis cerana cerana TaxID=94128 RepID=A0A2A3END5_APICC|nr:Epidermal retinol dehydrogenase [Apis cerana cerana]